MNQSGDENHIPVLLKEIVRILKPEKGKKYIDATLGFGGHSLAFLKAGAEVLGIEIDPQVSALTKKRFQKLCPNASWRLVKGNFAQVDKIAKKNKFFPVNGIIFDLGISRWHYKKAKRGFSFQDQELDMRLAPQLPIKALDIVNYFSYEKLNQAFAKLVQEKLAGPIAQSLVRARGLKKIETAKQLADLVKNIYSKKGIKTGIHPATKVFLALRIIVNQELENLEKGLGGAIQILKPEGRLLIISFHSGEDRIVKKFLKEKRKQGLLEKSELIFPGEEEIRNNPLSRSAKLRIAQKT